MPQAAPDIAQFREHICRSKDLHVLPFRDMWLQYTLIDDDLWFRDWHVVKALGAPSGAYVSRLLGLVRSDEAIAVLVDRGPLREEREIGGFIRWTGARRMADAVSSRPRRERFIAWLDAKLPQHTREKLHGSAKAEPPHTAATTRGRSLVPLS